MTDIKLTADNDIDLTGLQLSLVSDNVAIAQEIQIACRFFLGEWKLDRRIGIDFLGRILGKKGVTPDEVSNEYRRALQSIPGVTQIDSVQTVIDKATRIGTITFRVTTDAGTIVEGQEALVIHS